jgi:hypothetical protein
VGTDAGDSPPSPPARHRGGRPRVYEEPRRAVNLHLTETIIGAIDDLRGPESRVAYIERVLRERPEIAARLREADDSDSVVKTEQEHVQ